MEVTFFCVCQRINLGTFLKLYMKFNKLSLACLVLSGSALLAGCGGGSDTVAPAQIAASSISAVITPVTGAAVISSVLDKNFVFSSGVPAFGTTSPTTLTFSGTGAAPTFAISSAEGTASGVMTYGSCIFRITQSTFAAGQPLALGNSVTVTPCELDLVTAGLPGNGTPTSTTVTLQLGTANSTPVTVTVTISPTGVVTVGSSTLGSVTLTAATGAGS